MTTTFYHAMLAGGSTGVSFRIGASLIFAPVDEERLCLIDDPQTLLIGGPVAPAMATFLAATIIEPRLMALGGRP